MNNYSKFLLKSIFFFFIPFSAFAMEEKISTLEVNEALVDQRGHFNDAQAVIEFNAPGCPEQFRLSFLFAVANFNKNIKPKFINVLNKYELTKQLFVIRSEEDIKNIIKLLMRKFILRLHIIKKI